MAAESFTRDMLIKESEETDSKGNGIKLGGISVESEVLEKIKWASGTMFGGK